MIIGIIVLSVLVYISIGGFIVGFTKIDDAFLMWSVLIAWPVVGLLWVAACIGRIPVKWGQQLRSKLDRYIRTKKYAKGKK